MHGRSNRRTFVGQLAVGAGVLALERRLGALQSAPQRRQVMVGGRRVKTVDAHAHTSIPAVADVVRGTELERAGAGGGNLPMSAARLQAMDAQGIDVEVLTINPWWYAADRALAARIIEAQNDGLAKLCAANPDRFVALATVSLQHPELAADQLDDAFKRLKFRGASMGATVNTDELSGPKFDPFWKKAEELGALLFIHPQGVPQLASRLSGNGFLTNVIGNPLETTIALSHLIFDGTLDKFPGLRFCGAHAGGFLPSYNGRFDQGCIAFPQNCRGALKKKPSEYLKQMYFDSMVFTGEGLRHLVAEYGSSQIVMGTDYPFPWTTTSCDHILTAPGLTEADKTAILGGNLVKLLGIPG